MLVTAALHHIARFGYVSAKQFLDEVIEWLEAKHLRD
jgi:hypothetical protein